MRGKNCLAPRRDASGNSTGLGSGRGASARRAERLSYLDAGGRLASRETAQFAVVRDFDDRGNVISLMTERLTVVNRGGPRWPPPVGV